MSTCNPAAVCSIPKRSMAEPSASLTQTAWLRLAQSMPAYVMAFVLYFATAAAQGIAAQTAAQVAGSTERREGGSG